MKAGGRWIATARMGRDYVPRVPATPQERKERAWRRLTRELSQQKRGPLVPPLRGNSDVSTDSIH
jgi:hypothetical protein